MKSVLITGGAKGIGFACAKKFVKQGYKTIIVDIDEKLLSEAKSLINSDLLDTYVCDVSDMNQVNKVCEDVLKKYEVINVLVNNAGIFRDNRGPFNESEYEAWKKKIDCNIYGTLFFTRALINPMIKNKDGRIINLASVAAKYGIKNMADYSLTKGAVLSFSKALAKEVGQYNVRVNTVSPGNIEPDNRYPEMSYLDRSGTYDECANLIYFLASDEASFITGEDYVVDGGRRKI